MCHIVHVNKNIFYEKVGRIGFEGYSGVKSWDACSPIFVVIMLFVR